MTIKYEVHNQLTGMLEETSSFADAKMLRDRLRNEYIQKMVDPLFQISVLIQNENGSWTQTLADANGLPTPPPAPTQEHIDLVDKDAWAYVDNKLTQVKL